MVHSSSWAAVLVFAVWNQSCGKSCMFVHITSLTTEAAGQQHSILSVYSALSLASSRELYAVQHLGNNMQPRSHTKSHVSMTYFTGPNPQNHPKLGVNRNLQAT